MNFPTCTFRRWKKETQYRSSCKNACLILETNSLSWGEFLPRRYPIAIIPQPPRILCLRLPFRQSILLPANRIFLNLHFFRQSSGSGASHVREGRPYRSTRKRFALQKYLCWVAHIECLVSIVVTIRCSIATASDFFWQSCSVFPDSLWHRLVIFAFFVNSMRMWKIWVLRLKSIKWNNIHATQYGKQKVNFRCHFAIIWLCLVQSCPTPGDDRGLSLHSSMSCVIQTKWVAFLRVAFLIHSQHHMAIIRIHQTDNKLRSERNPKMIVRNQFEMFLFISRRLIEYCESFWNIQSKVAFHDTHLAFSHFMWTSCLILFQHYTFYDFIVTKARGKSGPLFSFDVHEDIRIKSDARIEKDEVMLHYYFLYMFLF